MADTPKANIADSSIPEADIQAKKTFSLVWIIPIIAIIIGSWLVYKTISEKGPEITIRFDTANGLEAGKTKIKYKEVEIGEVKTIRLSKDLSHVVITADMVREAENYLSENTRFWVVRARIAAGEISGIGTLFSGVYIGIDPGKQGKPALSFKGLERPPLVTEDTPGHHFNLIAEKLGSLDFGSPVYYRQIKVGQVVNYEMLPDGSGISITIFVKEPHDQNVFNNTRFWNASGVDAVIDSSGVKINTESVVALLIGGIAFETPKSLTEGKPADEAHTFKLHNSYNAINEPNFEKREYYLVYFNESVRGLKPGAPVEFRGIKVGQVVDIKLEFHHETLEFKIPVLIALETERITETGTNGTKGKDLLEKLVDKGLRVQLGTGMLLTGQLYVNFEIFPDAPPQQISYEGQYPVLPAIPAPLGEITSSVANFMGRLEKLPIEQIAEEINKTLKDAQEMLASKQIMAAMEELEKSLAQIHLFTSNLNQELIPKLEGTLESAKGSIDQIQKTLAGIEKTVDSDSPLAVELERTLQELSAAARSIRMTAEYLERHPDALIYGKEKQK